MLKDRLLTFQHAVLGSKGSTLIQSYVGNYADSESIRYLGADKVSVHLISSQNFAV